MKNIISIFLFSFLVISCKEKNIEFIQSKADSSLFLLKNLPKEDSLIRKEITLFLLKNLKNSDKKEDFYVRFYQYTWGTAYFLENEEDEGGPTSIHFLDNYDEYKIGSFIISKCKNDTTKLVGKLRFSNKYGNYYQPDTIINKCH